MPEDICYWSAVTGHGQNRSSVSTTQKEKDGSQVGCEAVFQCWYCRLHGQQWLKKHTTSLHITTELKKHPKITLCIRSDQSGPQKKYHS